jgi:hypothetical protein
MDDTSTPPPNVESADPKKDREIQKLDLEIIKLNKDVADSQRPYLWRNPQVIPTAIAALGAIIGLGLGLYSNYFTTLKDKADLDQKLATVAKNQADQERKDADEAKKAADSASEQAKKAQSVADETMRNANQTMQDAKDTKTRADGIIATEEEKIRDANRRSDIAAAQADRAERLNRDFRRYVHEMNRDRFKLTHLPDFVYDQQDQLHHLGLINMISQGGYDWVTDPELESIRLGVNEFQLESLKTVSPSIRELTVEAGGNQTFDLASLLGAANIKWFSLTIGGLGSAPEIHNLRLARDLESLELKVVNARLIGIEDALKLPHLRYLGVDYDVPSHIPSGVLDRVTTLTVSGARPIDSTPVSHDEFFRLARNEHLTFLGLSGQVDRSDWAALSHSDSLRELLVLNTELTMDPDIKFPRVTALLVSIGDPEDFRKVASAFPNLRDLAVIVGSSFDELNNIKALLDGIAAHYPMLHSLTLNSSLNIGRPVRYSFSRLPSLETLRLQLNSLDATHAVTVDLDPKNLPSLRRLVVNSSALLPGQLEKLPHLESLMLNDVTPGLLNEIQTLSNLHALGLSPSSYAPPGTSFEIPKGSAQKAISNLPLKKLILVGPSLITDIDRMPPTVASLDLEQHPFMPLGMDWFSSKYFSDTYQ